MSTPRVLGFKGVVEQPVQYSRKVGEPRLYVRTWKGPRAAIERFAAALELAGDCNVRLAGSGAGRTVQAEFADSPAFGQNATSGSQENEKWSCDYLVLNKPLATFLRFTLIPREVLTKIHSAIENNDADKQKEIFNTYEDNSPAVQYLRRRLIGEDTFETYVYVVKQTIVTSFQSVVIASYVGVNEVTKNDPSAAPTSSPFGRAHFRMPPGEYKKCPPRVSDAGRGKIQIDNEWHQAEKWDGVLYLNGTGGPV